jgi:hypothetical protein
MDIQTPLTNTLLNPSMETTSTTSQEAPLLSPSLLSIATTLLTIPTLGIIILIVYTSSLLLSLLAIAYIPHRQGPARHPLQAAFSVRTTPGLFFGLALQWLLCLFVGLALGFPLALCMVWVVQVLGQVYRELGFSWVPDRRDVVIGLVGLTVMAWVWMLLEGIRRMREIISDSETAVLDVDKGDVIEKQEVFDAKSAVVDVEKGTSYLPVFALGSPHSEQPEKTEI